MASTFAWLDHSESDRRKALDVVDHVAYIVPSDLSRLSLSGAHSAELKALQMLKAELPNDFTIFHY
ncbi:hypothetical protein [Thiolapillus sp.]|uniref:hypothetical protein n=1 Tax=Thiolapillus sp. TaxID=2017437 RepID=UPI003AF5B18D